MRVSRLILAVFHLPNPTLVKMVYPQTGQLFSRWLRKKISKCCRGGCLYLPAGMQEIGILWAMHSQTISTASSPLRIVVFMGTICGFKKGFLADAPSASTVISNIVRKIATAGQRKGRGVKPGCVCQQGIGRIYIEIEIFWNIIRDATAREPAHICQLILKPRKLIQICQCWGVI